MSVILRRVLIYSPTLTNSPAKGAEQLGNSVQVILTTYAEWIEEYCGLDNALLERKVDTEKRPKPDLRLL